MIQLLTSLVSIFFILLCGIEAQFDPEWCPEGPTPPVPDPKWSTVPSRFEILVEVVGDNGVMEIGQAFSPTRDSIAKNSGNSILLFVIISLF